MTLTTHKMTEDEFMRLPDDGLKYELVEGEAAVTPSGIWHDEIGAHMCYLLFPFTRGRGALCSSQAGYRMVSGNIRSPDVSFTLKERLPGGKSPHGFGHVAPDLVIEVISPSEERGEMQRKLEEYFASGAQQVWHMFPDTKRVWLYTSPSEYVVLEGDDEVDGGNLLPGFRCQVSQLFEIEE
jgi:Uma2 family endonuclease